MGSSGLNSKNILTTSGSVPPFAFEVGLGNIPGVKGVTRSGFNDSIGPTAEDLWPTGGQQVYLTAAETLDVVSTDVVDFSGGTGAHSILIRGLDNNFDEIEETLLLNGTTTVVTVNSYIRVHNVTVNAVGITQVNNGIIIASATTSGFTQGQIDPGKNGSLQFQYTIPNEKIGLFTTLNYSAANNDQVLFQLYVRPFEQGFVIQQENNVISNSFDFQSNPFGLIAAKSDIRILGSQIAGPGTVSASAILQLYLVDNV